MLTRALAVMLALAFALVPVSPRAAVVTAPAVPVSKVVTIQPIIVCSDSAGHGCATNAGILQNYETAANAVLDQAGIGLAFAAPEQVALPQYLNVLTDTSATSAFDTAHDLVRISGHGQSANPNTLNVYFVDSIQKTSNGVPVVAGGKNVYAYGYGLIGGNGAIVATQPDPSLHRQAGLDTLAHEISHNLGLAHVDDPPLASGPFNSVYNLMFSGSPTAPRTIPTDVCQIAPFTCTGALAGLHVTDQLAAFQIATLKAPPIFSELPDIASSLMGIGCTAGLCLQYDTSFKASSPTGVKIVKYRFTDPSTIPHDCIQAPTTCLNFLDESGMAGTKHAVHIGSHIEWDLTPTNPLNFPSAFINTFCPAGSPVYCSTNPTSAYSTEYDFVNGITSRAGFDGSAFVGQNGLILGFDPAGQPTGPSYLPMDIGAISPITGTTIGAETDTNGADPSVIGSVPYPFADFEPAPSQVPEPGGGLLLLAGVLCVGVARRSAGLLRAGRVAGQSCGWATTRR